MIDTMEQNKSALDNIKQSIELRQSTILQGQVGDGAIRCAFYTDFREEILQLSSIKNLNGDELGKISQSGTVNIICNKIEKMDENTVISSLSKKVPKDFIPKNKYDGEMLIIDAYYIPDYGYVGSSCEYIDYDESYKKSIYTRRHIVRHTFDNLLCSLFELPDKPGYFSASWYDALNGKSMGIIDKTSIVKVTDNKGKAVSVHPNYEKITDVYKMDSHYNFIQKSWQWMKVAISCASDICFIIKGAKLINAGTKAFKIIDKTGKVTGNVNNGIAVTEAGYRVVVDGADVVDTAGNLVQDLIPIWGTARSIINAWDYSPNYIIYYTDTYEVYDV